VCITKKGETMINRQQQKDLILNRDQAENIEAIEKPGVEILSFTNWKGTLCTLIWYGKQSRPAKYYGWPTEEKRQKYIQERLLAVELSETNKKVVAARKKAAKHPYKVGDILTGSWGYDQTNVDMYQVVAVKGKAIEIRAICQAMVEGSTGPTGMSCDVVPIKDVFLEGSKTLRKIPQVNIVGADDKECWYVKMASYYSLRLWDGKPKYNSWYA
tara:strand:+ start:6765 stop:7406 length:642 start_codon:yes stop_codon:yes gene_type:complete